MKISKLLSSEQKIRVISYLLSHPYDEIKIRRIASNLHLSPSLVCNIIAVLRKNGMIYSSKISISDPRIKSLKIFLNVLAISNLLPSMKKIMPSRGAGIYGSWANGTNTENSDIDLWLKLDKIPDIFKQATLSRLIREKLGAEPAILYLTPQAINELKGKDHVFYSSLMNSFLLEGESID